MTELKDQFIGTGEVDGYQFTQLKKSDTAYMYQVNIPDSTIIHYEVFERKEQQECDRIINGNTVHYEAKVKYPNANQFGNWAWTYGKFEQAEEKFNKL